MISSLAVIGAGHMGRALINGITKTSPGLEVLVSDRNQENLDALTVAKTSLNPLDVLEADAVMIAVKPQGFAELMETLGSRLHNKLVISIMAGVSIDRIAELTDAKSIVRTMPNLGVKVGHGVTAWIASEGVTSDEAQFVEDLLQPLGAAVEVHTEDQLDTFAPLVGCGPAYFFRLASELEVQATKRGFSPEDARVMAEQTFIAAAKLLEQGSMSAAEWADAVASKGGVTEAALKSLDESKTDEALTRAIEAALKRQAEL